MVDPVTGFLRESAAFSRMDELRKNGPSCLTIGFSLNNMAELNSTRGCTYSDYLVQNIADELRNKLSGKMTFYRLEGMCCMEVVDVACQQGKEQLVGQIRGVLHAGTLGAPALLLCTDGVSPRQTVPGGFPG